MAGPPLPSIYEGREARAWDPIRLRRRCSYVIQEVGLLPHTTVQEKVALVPRIDGRNRGFYGLNIAMMR
jgi:ABC-type proline/glycine betaine transport system ATPase subunit